MSATMDPYRALGLPPGASEAEVKRAYRRLAKALHPDAAGEAALPRFLEIQDAYERLTGTKVRTVRAPGSAASAPAQSATADAGAEGFREPWRADPARARAAREQARARRGWPGGQPGTATGGARRGPAGGSTTGTGAGTASGRADGTASSRTGRAAPGGSGGPTSEGQARGTGRRRASRKATLGSTSYDEAREPADRSWTGASWYGPTTGEYWHINPREYADPRKHGPGYSARGQGEPSEPEAAAYAARTGAAPGGAAASRAAPRRAAQSGIGAGSSTSSGGHRSGVDDRARGIDAMLGGFAVAWSRGPWRRLGLVLVAWPPLGLAAASAIGQATGCSSYSAACDATDRLLPWLAQVVLLALLLASPWLARVLSAGTIAALVALVPGVGIITALGGASSPAGGPVLAGWLAVAWLSGVAIGARRGLRPAASSPGETP